VNHLPSSLSRNIILADSLKAVSRRLASLSDTPGLDAQVLLAFVCQRERTWILSHPDYILHPEESLRMAEAMVQLSAGVPLPYVIGEWEFFGLPFKVNPEVLIPRPETELLVETALKWLNANPERRRAAEVGTGSGCIAISLAVTIPDLKITATDISCGAAATARENASRHQVQSRVRILENNLLDGLDGPFDLICANLPYIPRETLRSLRIFEREPTLALDGGENGLEIIAAVLEQAAEKLANAGLALFEIESGQGEQATSLAAGFFPKAEIKVLPDLAGHPRLLVIQN
jgi:release factor glutamine methyltransferase